MGKNKKRAGILALAFLSCSAQAVIEQAAVALLVRYQRPITVWDNGNDTQLAQALLKKFDSMIYIFSAGHPETLIAQRWPRLIVLDAELVRSHWEIVTDAEQVDLLLLSLDGQAAWQQYLERGKTMADHLLFWVHSPDRFMKAQLNKLTNVIWLDQDERVMVGLIETQNHYLRRKYSLFDGITIHAGPLHYDYYRIASDYDSKFFLKRRGARVFKTVWEPGINLITYKLCGGSYPTPQQLKQIICEKRSIVHDDWGAHNIILQGNDIALIDDHDPAHCKPRQACSEQDLDTIIMFLNS